MLLSITRKVIFRHLRFPKSTLDFCYRQIMTQIQLNQGVLKGELCKTSNGREYIRFLEIPYAKPPLGELRFKSPQPPEPWQGERDASKSDEQHIAYQFDQGRNEAKGSEDCLYLDVFTPKLPESDVTSLPVMVYIHGGGFANGSGTLVQNNNPEYLLDHDVVVVTINYRLNILGFLCLDIPEAAGNMGLKDQIMALKWIQNNVNKFGGDNGNVTLLGISAGAASIEYLLLSPLADGLFQKAILQSGSSINPWAINHNIKELGVKVAEELGHKNIVNNTRAVYDCLVKEPLQSLGIATNKVINTFNSERLIHFGFVPCIEKDFGNNDAILLDYPYILLKEGKFNKKVDVVKGFSEYEGMFLLTSRPKLFQKIREENSFVGFGYELLEKVDEYNAKFIQAYDTRDSKDDEDKKGINFFGDLSISSGVLISSKLMAKQGSKVKAYIFAYDGGLNHLKRNLNIKNKGATHADEKGYIFTLSLPDIRPSKEDILVRNRMTKMWTAFAKTGNPTPNCNELISVQWPDFDIVENKYMFIDLELSVKSNHERERMSIFEEIYDSIYANLTLISNKN